MGPSPRIAVVGTGANGASIAADLICAGHDVTLIDQWPENIEAMRGHGLRIEMPSGETLRTKVHALHLCEVATLRSDFDIVFLSVKAYDTRWACELIKPRLAGDGVLVGIQNGMTTDDVASIVGSDRSLGAVIGIAANMFEPGVVARQTPPAGTWFALGSTDGHSADKAEPVAELMRHSGTVEVTDDITSAKWMKLVGNAGEFLPTAILDLPMLEGLHVPGIRQIADLAGREAIETALALGHKIVPLLGAPDPGPLEPEQYSAVRPRHDHERLGPGGHPRGPASGLDEGAPWRRGGHQRSRR